MLAASKLGGTTSPRAREKFGMAKKSREVGDPDLQARLKEHIHKREKLRAAKEEA